jgi:hypothetical protein
LPVGAALWLPPVGQQQLDWQQPGGQQQQTQQQVALAQPA